MTPSSKSMGDGNARYEATIYFAIYLRPSSGGPPGHASHRARFAEITKTAIAGRRLAVPLLVISNDVRTIITINPGICVPH